VAITRRTARRLNSSVSCVMKVFSGCLLAVALLPSAHAKCANDLYAISGAVTDFASSQPLPGAGLAVTWTDPPGRERTISAQTDASGHYLLQVAFYPWSSGVHGADECNAKLTQVSVSISAGGFASQVVEQSLTGLATTANYSLKRTAANRRGVD
jgi:hypothetical protein